MTSMLMLMGVSFLCHAHATEDEPESKFATHIRSLHEDILQKGKTTDQLTESDLASLPIGIVKNIAGIEYMVMIDSAVFTPEGAFFSAYIALEFKGSGKHLAFAAKNIAFHPGGISASTESRMVLVDNKSLPFGSKMSLELLAGQNFVSFDCNGFKEVHLKGTLNFDRSLLLPEDADGNIGEGKVQASVEINTADFGDLLTNIKLPAFRVPTLMGVSFYVEDAAIDMSDIANPKGMTFPVDYVQSYGQNAVLWEGIYVKKAKVGLFKELADGEKRRYIYGENLIIDKVGLSGTLNIANIFGQEEGNMNGWPFSVDSLGITFVKNQLSGAAFKGAMHIPLFSKESPVQYTAMVYQEQDETNYQFTIQPGKTMKVSALAAQIELASNSTIIINKEDGKFKPEAILHGTLSVQQGDKASLSNIAFTDLHIASEKPYIRNGYWSLTGDGQQSVGNYPVSINTINFLHSQQQLQLDVNVLMGLMNSKDKGFSAATTVSVVGEITEVDSETTTDQESTTAQTEWKYKETRISDIQIDADMDAFALKGQLSFYKKHATYGQGFRGELEASFKAGPTVKAIAQFGKVNDYRYWYADALVKLSQAPPTPGFGVYGFGGGLYYHMSLEREDLTQAAFVTVTGDSDKHSIGATRSGARYIPDHTVGLGLKASVIVGTTPSARPFNGDATYEMAFNKRMGVKYIRFRGEGYFLTDIDQRDATSPVYANLDILYDFENKALNAFLDTYVNVADVLRGTGLNGLAGSAILHFSEEDWYIWIGSPSQRMGLNLAGIAEANAYMMVGTKVEDMPPPLQGVNISSEKLQKLLSEMDDNLLRNETETQAGKGFVFGASFNTSIGKDDPGALFYGFFEAGAGFDIMLKDYGNTSCVGASGPVGINGWYASGQAWAYLQGAVGVNVNLKFIKGKFEAFRFLGAIIMQAQLPNPYWMQGAAIGEFNILGGLVKGDCSFKVTLGERCELENSRPIGINVIADMQPTQGSKEVDVFTAPQVAFNVAVDTPIEMLNAENKYESYQIKLKHFKITNEDQAIAGSLAWNDEHTVLAFNTEEILPPKATLKAEVLVAWQKKENGTWKDMDATEARAVIFTTGEAPDYIPANNIAYSYPVNRQYNFLADEYAEGYLKLKKGQSYLFQSTDEQGRGWSFAARFQKSGSPDYADIPLTYQAGNITFAIPTELTNTAIYQLSLIKKPVNQILVDENVARIESNAVETSTSTVTTSTQDIKGNLILAETETLFNYFFRTSAYNTFSEKMNAMTGYRTSSGIDSTLYIFKVGGFAQLPEAFDAVELEGQDSPQPLIKLTALTDNVWYKDYIGPLLYEKYPVNDKIKITWREPLEAGTPPIYSVVVEQSKDGVSLSEAAIQAGTASTVASGINFSYQMPSYTYQDFWHLRPKAINYYIGKNIDTIPIGAKRLIKGSYQNVLDEKYQYTIEYCLPGINKITTSKTLTIDW